MRQGHPRRRSRSTFNKRSGAGQQRRSQLKASGRLTPAGAKRTPTDRSGDAPRPSPSKVPQYIQQALRSRPTASIYFESLAPSYRSMYIAWIDSAKQQATKRRRLQEAIGLLAAGKKLGLK